MQPAFKNAHDKCDMSKLTSQLFLKLEIKFNSWLSLIKKLKPAFFVHILQASDDR